MVILVESLLIQQRLATGLQRSAQSPRGHSPAVFERMMARLYFIGLIPALEEQSSILMQVEAAECKPHVMKSASSGSAAVTRHPLRRSSIKITSGAQSPVVQELMGTTSRTAKARPWKLQSNDRLHQCSPEMMPCATTPASPGFT